MSLVARAATNPRIVLLSTVIFIACAWLVLSSFDSVQLSLPSRPLLYGATKSHKALHNLFHSLHVPAIRPGAATYTEFSGREWTLPAEPKWKKLLGEDLCIIDLDSRAFNQEGGLFHEGPMGWDSSDGLSVGLLNHYLYASIHGYKYYYIQSKDPADRRASWRKPPVISQILKHHKICLYLDSDAVFNHLELPFEWLLNYWQIEPDKTAVAVALDPNSPNNLDKFGRVNGNTGFIVSQNLPRTHEIYSAWESCPDTNSKYENCTIFRLNAPGLPTDQGGFNTYIRYDYNQPDDIKELKCTEGNGFPGSRSGCEGEFIRHFWTNKDEMLKGGVGETLAGSLLQWGHEDFLMSKSNFYMEEGSIKDRLG